MTKAQNERLLLFWF